jgi:hypothetical protein
MTFDGKPSLNFILMWSCLAVWMDDGISPDSDTQNGVKRAVGGAKREKAVFGVFWGFAVDEKLRLKF